MPARRLIPLLLLLVCGCAAPKVSPGEAPRQGEDPPPMDASSARRLQLASVILMDGVDDMDAATRGAAASELVSLGLPQSREVLIDALRSARAEVLQAVLESMLAEAKVDHEFGPVLLEVLATAPIDVQPVLAELLARHGQADVRMLLAVSAMALDTELPAERRTAAIGAIGAFRHAPAQAASELMQVLQQPHGPDDAVAAAAAAQLSHLTGMPRSTTPPQWIAWWKQNRNRPAERWLEDTVDALTKEAARRVKELSEARAARDRMSDRLLAAYREFWPLLSIEQQQDRLLPLLEDELASVRMFGLDRLAVQLRDGHDSPGGQEAAAALLSDPDAAVRAAAAALIPELDPAAIDPAVVANFPTEHDPLVLAAMLPRVAAIQPDLITPEKIGPLLASPAVRPAAIAALWTRLSDPASRTDSMAAEMLPLVRNAWAIEQTPSSGALLTLIGTPDDVAVLEPRLDDPDSTWRAAIANAMHTRGMYGPLLARTSDPAIYPFALRAVGQSGDVAGVRAIGQLSPPEQHTALWMQALLDAARQTNPAEALQVDDLLSAQPTIAAAQRAALLQEAFSSGDVAEQDLVGIAKRLGPLVLQTGDPRAVVAMIDNMPANRVDAELLATKFEAAIRGRLYDEAATVHEGPDAWITAFERLQQLQPEVADLVRTEIVRRFEDDLDAAMRARLGMATDPMMGEADPGDAPG